MSKDKIVVFMGSNSDFPFASRLEDFLQREGFSAECEYVVASAHKTPQKLLEEIRSRDDAEDMVFVTVAGLSDALSGVVAGSTRNPVIACPPDSDKYGWAKVFSSAITPLGIAVAYIHRPENAALFAVKILALSNEKLQKEVDAYGKRLRERLLTSSRSPTRSNSEAENEP